jgi:hypothetical protein
VKPSAARRGSTAGVPARRCRSTTPGAISDLRVPPANIADALQRDPDNIKVVVDFGG